MAMLKIQPSCGCAQSPGADSVMPIEPRERQVEHAERVRLADGQVDGQRRGRHQPAVEARRGDDAAAVEEARILGSRHGAQRHSESPVASRYRSLHALLSPTRGHRETLLSLLPPCRASPALVLSVPAPAAEPEYDLLIANGRIVDGTGNPWFHGDVAIKGDRIVAVGRVPEGKAKRTIDAKGLVVAPGFIDMHSHSDDLLLEDGHAQSKIRQGVTTEVLGEGRSAGPLKGQLVARKFKARGKEFTWNTLGGYFDADREGRRERERRQLRRPGQRLGSGDGQVARPAHARSNSTR